MPVAIQIEAFQRLTYQASVQMVMQQTRNPLMDTVTTIRATGEAMSAGDMMNAGEYVYGEERSRTNVENPASGSRRWLIRPPEIKSGQYIDDEMCGRAVE